MCVAADLIDPAGRSSDPTVRVDAEGVTLDGVLALPAGAPGLVVFAHGSGSSRFSPRNRYVADALRAVGLGTLLFDLLSPEEEEIDLRTRHLRFDIPLLAERVAAAVDWATDDSRTASLPVGLFGSSTGAAAALKAAARRPDRVRAVVSRGGRPDLAGVDLAEVRAPALFIVGGLDDVVIDLNREAMARMAAEVRLEIVPGATHLFEEPGTLEAMTALAAAFFKSRLPAT